MIGRTVLEPVESQSVAGYVSGVVAAADGTTKIIVDYGGIFGIGARPIAVPVAAMALLGRYVEIVDFDRSSSALFRHSTGQEAHHSRGTASSKLGSRGHRTEPVQ